MLKRSTSLGIAPHILTLDCEDYQDLLDEHGEVDDVKLLQLVSRLLREKAEKLAGANRADPKAAPPKAVVIYGGALHNDLDPPEELAEFSFAPALKKSTEGKYVQLGLYVPELLERDDTVRKAAWYPYFTRYASPTRTLLITLSPEAQLLIFPRTALKPAKR